MIVDLVTLIAGTVIWALTVVWLRARRHWLLYYLAGGLGLILVVLFWSSTFGLDTALEAAEAGQTVGLSGFIGIALSLLGKTGIAIPNHTGWAVFDVGIECSALLEMSAIIGLIAFYPGFSPRRKVLYALIGVAVTYAVNLARIMLIVGIINAFGTSWVFTAHAVFGRVFFFIGTVVLYWWIVTRPTVGAVAERIETPAAEAVADE